MIGKSDEPARTRGGWPAWDLKAEQILKGIREWVERGDEDSFIAFHNDFLEILDAFLSQLIDWAEQKDSAELREWAGWALADRLQFLSAQQRDWCNENEGFKKRRAQFGDRRHSRSPRSYLGWLAGDYLHRLMRERLKARILLSPSVLNRKKSPSIAEKAGYSNEQVSWLRRLGALPDFFPNSASEWGNVVFERMQDEEQILNSPAMRKRQTRDSMERRRSGRIQLYDYKRTIVGAVVRLATKPVGQIRGITRPA